MKRLSDEERVIRRALALMRNRGFGWSKAIAAAADTVKKTA